MSAASRMPIAGRAGWYGSELQGSGSWMRRLGEREIAEIEAALARVRGMPFLEIGKEDFPLAATAGLLAEVAAELEDGLGLARISGLPVARYDEEELRRIFWG